MALTFSQAMEQIRGYQDRLARLAERSSVQQVMDDQIKVIELGLKAMTANRGQHVILAKHTQNSASVVAKGPMIPYLRPALLKQHKEGAQKIKDAIEQEIQA